MSNFTNLSLSSWVLVMTAPSLLGLALHSHSEQSALISSFHLIRAHDVVSLRGTPHIQHVIGVSESQRGAHDSGCASSDLLHIH